MKYFYCIAIAVFLALDTIAMAQDIPAQLRGNWVVTSVIPTATISCWGDREAKKLLGTELEYTADSFRWQDKTTLHPAVTVAAVTAEQFARDNSGAGAQDSQVNFQQLGIKSLETMQVSLSHADADITGGTVEIPGDKVLVNGRNVIIFSVCNVYFDAVRKRGRG